MQNITTSPEIARPEQYSYWYLNSAYIARTQPDSRIIEHYDPPSRKWKVEDRILFIKWPAEGRREITEAFADKMIKAWAANWKN